MSASAEQHLLVFLILVTYKFIRLRRFVGRHNSNNDIKILFCFIFFLLNNLKNIDVPLILVSTIWAFLSCSIQTFGAMLYKKRPGILIHIWGVWRGAEPQRKVIKPSCLASSRTCFWLFSSSSSLTSELFYFFFFSHRFPRWPPSCCVLTSLPVAALLHVKPCLFKE